MSTEAIVVLGAGIFYYCLTGIWYTVMGKRWLNAWKLEEESLNPKNPTPYLVAFIGSLWTSYGYFILIKHIAPKNVIELITISIGVWLFIVVGTTAKHYAFSGQSLRAFLIDYTIDLIGVVLMGFMIWGWAL